MTNLDLFLSNSRYKGLIFSVETKLKSKKLWFVIQAMKWNDEKQRNDYKTKVVLSPIDFANWLDNKLKSGWIIAK